MKRIVIAVLVAVGLAVSGAPARADHSGTAGCFHAAYEAAKACYTTGGGRDAVKACLRTVVDQLKECLGECS